MRKAVLVLRKNKDGVEEPREVGALLGQAGLGKSNSKKEGIVWLILGNSPKTLSYQITSAGNITHPTAKPALSAQNEH